MKFNNVAKVLLICCASFMISFASYANQKIGTMTKVFYDESRDRSLLTELYYPTNDKTQPIVPFGVLKREASVRRATLINQKHPLVLVSHGYGGDRVILSWICEHLAKHGYLVAAVDHYGNSSYFDSPEIALQRWQRPKDIQFLLTSLLNDESTQNLINQEQIGFVGYSLGGLTGIWLSGGIADKFDTPNLNTSSPYELARDVRQKDIDDVDYTKAKQSYKDERIKAFFLLAPAHGFSFSSQGLKEINSPISIVVGEKDDIAPSEENAHHYAKHTSGDFHVFKGNIGHLVFRNQVVNELLNNVPAFQFQITDQDTQKKIQAETNAMALKFFSNTLK